MLESRSGAAVALLRTSVAAFAHHSPAAYDITSEGFEPHITGVGFRPDLEPSGVACDTSIADRFRDE